MRTSRLLRCALSCCAAAAMLAGCGGSQPPIGASGALPQASALATHADHGKSWMKPEAKSKELLYVTSGDDVYVYTYPQGRLVGTLTGFMSPLGECVDAAGNVFIVTLANKYGSSGIVYEYAHGGTQPIVTLNDPAGGYGCAIDPTSGNLAVANMADSNNPYGDYGDVAVYANAQGGPTMYYSSEFASFGLCGYDAKGNLYLSTFLYGSQSQLVRLAADSSEFELISLKVTLYNWSALPSVQRDGKYMTVSSSAPREPAYVYRLRISGDTATVVGTTTLSSKRNGTKSGQIWIEGKRVLGAAYFFRGKGGVDSWSYPNAGETPDPRTAHRKILSLRHNRFARSLA